MQIQTQTNRWSCLPTAFAMLLDVPVADLITEIGHDGSDVLWPRLPEPKRRRSFHIQELLDCAIRRGVWLTPIEFYPNIQPEWKPAVQQEVVSFPGFTHTERLLKYITGTKGVLIGESLTGSAHAVAFDDPTIYDPSGHLRTIDDFAIEIAWILRKASQ